MLRVFHDRLVSSEDRAWFCRFMSDMVEQHLGLQFDQVAQVPADVDPSEVREVAALRNIMYCSFLTQVGGNSKLHQHGGSMNCQSPQSWGIWWEADRHLRHHALRF